MRQIYEDVSSSAKSKKLPVKWMAPESLYQGLYTTKSDVYVQKIPSLLNTFRYIAAQKTSATLKIVISEFNSNRSRIPVVNIVGSVKREGTKRWRHALFPLSSSSKKKRRKIYSVYAVSIFLTFVLFSIVGLLVLFFGRWLHWVSRPSHTDHVTFQGE